MIPFLRSLPMAFARPRGPSLREQMLEDFRACTQPLKPGAGPMTSRTLSTPSGSKVELKLSFQQHGFRVSRPDQLIIERLIADVPGQGDGRFAMDRLTAMADARGVHLGMFMVPIAHRAMDMDSLIGWSEKYGFVEYNMPAGLFWREPGGARHPEPALS